MCRVMGWSSPLLESDASIDDEARAEGGASFGELLAFVDVSTSYGIVSWGSEPELTVVILLLDPGGQSAVFTMLDEVVVSWLGAADDVLGRIRANVSGADQVTFLLDFNNDVLPFRTTTGSVQVGNLPALASPDPVAPLSWWFSTAKVS